MTSTTTTEPITPTQLFAAAWMPQIAGYNSPYYLNDEAQAAEFVAKRTLGHYGHTHMKACPNGWLGAQYREDEIRLVMFDHTIEQVGYITFAAPDAVCPPTTLAAFVAVVNAWSTK